MTLAGRTALEPTARLLPVAATLALVTLLASVAAYPVISRWIASRRAAQRLEDLEANESKLAGSEVWFDSTASLRMKRLGSLLASWETVGGCGAGASTGTSGALKWIGRNVTGGALHVELQADYVNLDYGYNYVATALISRDLTPTWNVGVIVPYIYKFIRDPYGLGINLGNQGLGDMSLMVTARLGRINDWNAIVLVGAPTGVYNATFRNAILAQDQQLGFGEPTASAILDHMIDKDWGLMVLGGSASWRGGKNELQSYRAPSASLYGYAGYTLGPFVPAIGISATGFTGHDEDQLVLQATPLFSVAGNVSVEWSTDYVAVLAGASLPYGYIGSISGAPAAWGVGAWLVGVGVAVAPF